MMVEINLNQIEADALVTMAKVCVDNNTYEYPGTGGNLTIPLSSEDHRESFLLDIWKSGNIALKGRYQNRARHVVILARLDFGGAPHRNPDDTEVAAPHLHIYKEGFGDKWAMPLSAGKFPHPDDLWQTMEDFMRYCNIIVPPAISRGLFL